MALTAPDAKSQEVTLPASATDEVTVAAFGASSLFEIAGRDAGDYLHRQLSNEIRHLKPGEGVPVCYLNAQGRIRLFFDLWSLPNPRDDTSEGSGYYATVVGSQRTRFLEEMERMVFREEIEFIDRSSELKSFVLFGSSAPTRAGQIASEAGSLENHRFLEVNEPRGPVIFFRQDWLAVPTYLLWVSEKQEEILRSLSEEAKTAPLEETEFHALRIEKGTPWPDREITDAMIPYECGLESAVSLTKGCYVGQEVIARMANLGSPPRLLRGLILEGPGAEAPSTGTAILHEGVTIGEILSASRSQRLDRIVATSSVRKKFSKEGTRVLVGDQPAVVHEFPLGSK